VGPLAGAGRDLREAVPASDGVTCWAASEKAKRELGYAPRALDEDPRDLLRTAPQAEVNLRRPAQPARQPGPFATPALSGTLLREVTPTKEGA